MLSFVIWSLVAALNIILSILKGGPGLCGCIITLTLLFLALVTSQICFTHAQK